MLGREHISRADRPATLRARAPAPGRPGRAVGEAGNAAFSPTQENFDRARRITEAYARAVAAEGGGTGVVVDSEMVDEASVKLAAAIVRRGRAAAR